MRPLLSSVALALALVGCGGFRTTVPTVYQYRLAYAPPVLEAERLPVVVNVRLFDVGDAYNRESIVYREGPYEMGTYSVHRWMATPPRMVTNLLANDLATSGRYDAVGQGAMPLRSDYELSGEVVRMEELVVAGGCEAELEVRVILARATSTRRRPEPLLFQRGYDASVPCDAASADGFVAAMSEAMRRVSEEVQRDTYAAIAADLRAAPAEVAADAVADPEG